MNIVTFCGAGICAVCVILVIKQFKNEFHPIIAAATGVVLMVYIILQLAPSLSYLKTLAYESGLNSYFSVMARCLGIAFICQTVSEICRDCGESAIGSKIELGGKAAIIIQTLPIVKSLLEMAKETMNYG
ncbi:MAG: SpoIIIAC/SpoIIIAD family protein [Clostridia bacterium]